MAPMSAETLSGVSFVISHALYENRGFDIIFLWSSDSNVQLCF